MARRTRTNRPESWRLVLQRRVQDGIDTAADLSDALAERLNAAADPRAKLLRRRRWALRLGVFFAVACGFWIAVTAVLASWSIPAWALIIPGVIAAGAAFPATLLLLRYRWLRATPLPPERPRTMRRLPPWGSAARASMAGLASSERGMSSLLGVLERGRMLPPDELRDLSTAAHRSAATMAATAADVAAMEKTMASAPQSRTHLASTVAALTAQLDAGVRQYDGMVSAAAQLVSAADTGYPMSQQRYRDELVSATDRLLGWAQAFDELGRVRRGA